MKCVYCGNGDTGVVNSAKTRKSVVRARKCKSCGKIFFTEEHETDNPEAMRNLLRSLHDKRVVQERKKVTE